MDLGDGVLLSKSNVGKMSRHKTRQRKNLKNKILVLKKIKQNNKTRHKQVEEKKSEENQTSKTLNRCPSKKKNSPSCMLVKQTVVNTNGQTFFMILVLDVISNPTCAFRLSLLHDSK